MTGRGSPFLLTNNSSFNSVKFSYLSVSYIMPKKKNGKGFIDSLANKVLSNKHNIALPGKKHQIIYLPDGTYNPARLSGPGTNLKLRISRND